jgi:hypothetical protein
MNAATTDFAVHPVWMEAVMAVPMDDDPAPTPTTDDSSDEWVSQVLTECYN